MTLRNTLARRVLLFTFTNSAGKFIRLATAFLVTPFVLHRLGATEYGLWMLVGSIVGYGSLLDFGVASAVVKYVAQYNAKGELRAARGMVATALWLYILLALIAVGLGFAIAPFFGDWFHIPQQERARTSLLVYIMAIGIGLAIPQAATTSVLAGLQRFDLLNIFSVFSALLSAITTVLVLVVGGGLLAVVVASTAVTAVMQIPAVWLVRHVAPELGFGLRGADRRLIRTIVSSSSSIFIMDLSGCLLTRTDEIIIAAFLPVSAVSPFVLARRLGELPQTLTDQFVRVILPLASDIDARGDCVRLRSFFLAATRVTLAISLAFTWPLVILAGPALRVWVGAAYEPYGYLLVMLAVSSTIDIAQWPAGFLLQGTGRHRRFAYISAAVALVSVVLSILLVPMLGLAGVALGTLIPNAVGLLAFTLPYAISALGVSWREVAMSSYAPPLMAGIPAALLCAALDHILRPSSLVTTGAIGFVTVLTYGAVYLWVAARHAECLLCRQLTQTAWERIRSWRGE